MAFGGAAAEEAAGAPAADADAAASPSPSPTGTNVQEAGVDEPDIVKTADGIVFAVAQGKIQAVDVSGGAPQLVGSLTLPDGAWGGQLLLEGDRLAPDRRRLRPRRAAPGNRHHAGPDRHDADRDRRLEPCGHATRQDAHGGRLARRRAPDGLDRARRRRLPAGRDRLGLPGDGRRGGHRRRGGREQGADPPVAASQLGPDVPREELRDGHGVRAPAARTLRRGTAPAEFSGLGSLTVLTIDLARGIDPVDTDSVMAGGETVYASPTGLYVATQRWVDVPLEGDVQDPPRGDDAHPQVRRLELPVDRLPRQRSGLRLPAQPVVAVGARRQPPCGHHRRAGLVGRPRDPVEEHGLGARRERRSPGGDRPGGRHRPRRAGLRRSLHRGARLRRHLPPGRPVARHRPVGPRASRGARRAAHPRLLRLLAPHRRGTAHGRRAGRDRRRARAGNAGVRVRRVRSGQPGASAPPQPRPGLVAGRVGPPRLPLRRAAEPRRAAVRNLDLGRGDGDLELLERRRRAPRRPAGRRPAAHDRAPRHRVSRRTGAGGASPSDGGGSPPSAGEEPPVVPPEVYPTPIQRSLVLGSTLYTLSEAGLKATSLDTFEDTAWVEFPLP